MCRAPLSGRRRRLCPVPVAAERTLIVEARDLDTDERMVATFEVQVPSDSDGQRDQLARAVAKLHPQARMRSFGGGAASFLDSRQLVVAHYAAPVARETADRAPVGSRHADPQPLFAI